MEISTPKSQPLCFLKLADAFNNVDRPTSATLFPVSKNGDNSIILWHRAPLKMHPLVLVRFSVSNREHFTGKLSSGFEDLQVNEHERLCGEQGEKCTTTASFGDVDWSDGGQRNISLIMSF